MLIDSADALNSEAKAPGGRWQCWLGLGASSATTLKEEQELPGERYQEWPQMVANLYPFLVSEGLNLSFCCSRLSRMV